MSRSNLTWDYLRSRRGSWGDPYQTCHRNIEPRNFQEFHGIRVYESGLIEIRAGVSGNPTLRKLVHDLFGLDFRLVSETPNIVFHAPDGKLLHKKHIKSEMLLLDWKTKRAFAYRHWTHKHLPGITLVHPDAIPVSHVPVDTDQPDRARIKELKALHKDTIDVLVTTYSLMGNARAGLTNRIHGALSAMMQGEVLDPATYTAAEQAALGFKFAPDNINDTFEKHVRTKHEYEHIYFSTKE